MKNKPKIYLAGSFFDFRDKIIRSLPNYNFSDPRKHGQTAIAQLVTDDMSEAEECPVVLACFPKGKSRGTMTYAEIGASVASGNKLITVDETENPDLFLKSLSYLFFTDLDSCINHLNSKELSFYKKQKKLEGLNQEKTMNIYLCGQNGYSLEELVNCKSSSDLKKRFFLQSNDLKTDFYNFYKMDLTVVYFPHDDQIWLGRDRTAIFFMGVSWAYKTPIILVEENPIVYPPLAGLSRRIFNNLDIAKKYLERIGSLDISQEAQLMYQLFKEYKS